LVYSQITIAPIKHLGNKFVSRKLQNISTGWKLWGYIRPANWISMS